MSPLYHYTCRHRLPLILAEGVLRPNVRMGPGLLWLTDMDVPVKDALGLTAHYIDCDRTECRLTIDPVPDHVIPWWRWRRAHPDARTWAYLWENADGARPMHWWVTEQPIGVVLP